MAALEARLVIQGTDKTGAAFAAIEKKMSDIGKAFGGAGKMSQAFSGIGTSARDAALAIDKMGQGFGIVSSHVSKVERQVGLLGRSLRGLGNIARSVTPLMTTALSLGAIREGEKGVKAGADIASEKVKMQVAGITPEGIKEADEASVGLMAKYPNVPRSGVLETYKELYSVLPKKEEVIGMLDFAVKAKSTILAQGGDPTHFVYALKAGEKLGKANDPAVLQRFIDAYLKGEQVLGKTIEPEDMLTAARGSRAEGMMLSDRFLSTTMMGLIQAIGAPGTGKALAAWGKDLSGPGLSNNHAALLAWKALGALNENDFTRTKTGEIKGLKPGHHIKGYREALTDPDTFFYNRLLPAIEHKVGKDPIAQNAYIQQLLPGAVAAGMITELRGARPTFESQALKYPLAMGASGGEFLMKHDPNAAMPAATTSLTNMLGTAFAPLTEKFAPAAFEFSRSVGTFSGSIESFMKAYPNAGPAAIGGGAMAALLASLYGAYRGARALFGRGAPKTGPAAAESGLFRTVVGGALPFAARALSLPGALLYPSSMGPEDERARQMRLSTIPGSVAAPLSAAAFGPRSPVTAQLSGQAAVTVDLRLDATPELSRLVQFVANTGVLASGDLGTSMPEAAPNGRSGGR